MKFQVKYWMTPNPLAVDKDEEISAASELMRQEAISHLVVFDECKLIGVLSDVDLKIAETVKSRLDKGTPVTVGDLMSRIPVTILPSAEIGAAISLMEERHIRCLPVVDQHGDVVGILTQSDAMRFALVASQRLGVSEEERMAKVL